MKPTSGPGPRTPSTPATICRIAGQPYEAFIPSTIAKSAYLPSPGVAALAEEATQEISRFDERYGKHLRPFVSLMLRSESVASSQIENLTASA